MTSQRVVSQTEPLTKTGPASTPWWFRWKGDGRLHLVIWTGLPCCGCGCNVARIGEYYHVRDQVWAEAGACKHALLCIGCLEGMLGRLLVREDFSDAGINWSTHYPHPHEHRRRPRSARFRDRLGQPA
jgi:hypothetical protein